MTIRAGPTFDMASITSRIAMTKRVYNMQRRTMNIRYLHDGITPYSPYFLSPSGRAHVGMMSFDAG